MTSWPRPSRPSAATRAGPTTATGASIQMFGNVVLEIPKEEFEGIFDGQKRKSGLKRDTELTPADLARVIADYKRPVRKRTGKYFPQEPPEQLRLAIEAVFASSYNPGAAPYRANNQS